MILLISSVAQHFVDDCAVDKLPAQGKREFDDFRILR